MTNFAGRCHCGNIEVNFETAHEAEALAVRACDCSFCRRHGMRAVSDPEGSIAITIHDPARANLYRFGLKTADFLICGECGVYVAAVMNDDGATWATLNVNTLDDAAAFGQAPAAVSYEGESAEARRARRRENWTPATVLAQLA
jgi:hypothetical protein